MTRGGEMQKMRCFFSLESAYMVPIVIAAGSAGGTTCSSAIETAQEEQRENKVREVACISRLHRHKGT